MELGFVPSCQQESHPLIDGLKEHLCIMIALVGIAAIAIPVLAMMAKENITGQRPGASPRGAS